MVNTPTILWFRNDLRLDDHPAVMAAVKRGAPVIPLYVLDEAGQRPMGGASRWWLHHSLKALQQKLEERGSRLILRQGKAAEVMEDIIAATGAGMVVYGRAYDRWQIAQQQSVEESCKKAAIPCQSFNSSLLFEPWEITTQQQESYRVFTPFWRRCMEKRHEIASPSPAPSTLPLPSVWPESLLLDAFTLKPIAPDWAAGFVPLWQAGEDAAMEKLRQFLSDAIQGYKQKRNLPAIISTSRLSPHLRFGEISPKRIWSMVEASRQPDQDVDRDHFLSEVGWREFSYHLLYYFPQLPEKNFRPMWDDFPWQEDAELLHRWQQGQTGYPMVDAGMRELWHTGWMHNRVRMIVGSFLVKHLLLPWQAGEAWFWDTLLDADIANNSASWQWVAGSGADAAPYFRIFNPILQGETYDPDGSYIRRWLPELSALPNHLIHQPWRASPVERLAAGLDVNYPIKPVVDHADARKKALAAYSRIK